MEASVEYLGAKQFEIQARQHRIVSDQPAENGGDDEGMTPPELLLASLGSCAAYYAVDYLNRHQLEASGTKVKVTAEKVKAPFRLDQFRIKLDIPGDLNGDQLTGVEDAVHRCLIHNTLLHSPEIQIEILQSAAS